MYVCIDWLCVMYTCMCQHMNTSACRDQKKVSYSLVWSYMWLWDAARGCWEPNSGPLVLLTIELFLHPDLIFFWGTASHWTWNSSIELVWLANELPGSTGIFFPGIGVTYVCHSWLPHYQWMNIRDTPLDLGEYSDISCLCSCLFEYLHSIPLDQLPRRK